MASQGCRRCPQHTTHLQPQQHCLHCPLRRHCHHCPLHNPHFHAVNLLKPQFQPCFAPFQKMHSNFEPLHSHHHQQQQQPIPSNSPIPQELEHIDHDGEEEDDDPVFVLTDEWREFFAKSEARRKLEKKKKQGKKGKK
ncbi:uncharacterized protein LOC114166487 [Vigna unguiculata]|uniref:uncharacterized protein LOC114166487 n=1 Tax=Vigna unguiculata TaxID=3917 RepID=UPI0010164F58|nr:uncharacterized protein LOC114166487 [Vigna unguiculata]